MDFIVYKIEADAENPGSYRVFARDADESKKKRRKLDAPTTDPTSFYVGQKVRPMLEDAG